MALREQAAAVVLAAKMQAIAMDDGVGPEFFMGFRCPTWTCAGATDQAVAVLDAGRDHCAVDGGGTPGAP